MTLISKPSNLNESNELRVIKGEYVSVIGGRAGSGKTRYVAKLTGELSDLGNNIRVLLTEESQKDFIHKVVQLSPNANLNAENLNVVSIECIDYDDDIKTIIEERDGEFDFIIVDSMHQENVNELYDYYESKRPITRLIFTTQLGNHNL